MSEPPSSRRLGACLPAQSAAPDSAALTQIPSPPRGAWGALASSVPGWDVLSLSPETTASHLTRLSRLTHILQQGAASGKRVPTTFLLCGETVSHLWEEGLQNWGANHEAPAVAQEIRTP